MKIKKGTKLIIDDSRKGIYNGIAEKDFDTQKDEWYPIILDQELISGLNSTWYRGETLPCRKGISKIEVRK